MTTIQLSKTAPVTVAALASDQWFAIIDAPWMEIPEKWVLTGSRDDVVQHLEDKYPAVDIQEDPTDI